jgi:hypothetical protein
VNLNASESVNCTLNFNGTRYGHSAYDTSIDWVIPQQADGNYSTVNATCADLVNNRARTLASWWAVDATTADLQIGAANISLSDTTPQTGDTVTITPTMQNLGSTASGNFTVAFLVNGVESATTGNISILGRSTNTTTFSWEPESAINYNLTIVVDYYDNITESMESNNNATRSVTVSSRGGGNNKKGGGSGGGGGGGTTGGLITDLSKLIPQENGTLPGFGTQGAGSAAANGTLRVVFLSQPQEGAEFAVVVLDSSGNPVEGVTVTYGNQTAVTGSDGKVVFIGLPGSVGLSIAKSGYAGSVETVASAPAPAQQAPPAAARKKSKEDPMLMYSALAGIALLVIFVIYMLVIRPRRFR